jgi:hypothetical protein
MLKRLVQVFDLDGVMSRPQSQCGGCRSQSYKRKHRKSSRQPERASNPAGEWVGNQPTGVRQGELCRVDCRPVGFMRGTPK